MARYVAASPSCGRLLGASGASLHSASAALPPSVAPGRIQTPLEGDAAPSLASAALSSVEDALQRGISVLSESSGSTRADALLLLAHALGRTREWIVAYADAQISDEDLSLFIDLCERRRHGEPVSYITGSAWFYGREFIVEKSVLVPRPETEHLVEEAVSFVREHDTECRVLDVGTGSGAIGCSIAAETSALVDGTDISGAAIEMAKRNAERLGVTGRCRFLCGDLAAPVEGRRYDVVIANLPYLPTGELVAAPDPTSFEPRVALDGGTDGLTVYRTLLAGIADLVAAKAMVLLEAAPPTIEGLKELTHASLRDFMVTVGYDYAGLARYVKGTTK